MTLDTEQEIKEWMKANPLQAEYFKKIFDEFHKESFESFDFTNPIDEWEILRIVKYSHKEKDYNPTTSKVIVLLKYKTSNVYRIGEIMDDYSYSEIPASWGEILLKNLPDEFIEHFWNWKNPISIDNT